MSPGSARRLALFEAFLAAVLEASSYIGLKIGQQEMSPLAMAALRNLCTFIVLSPVLLVTGTHLQLKAATQRGRAGLVVMGVLGYCVASLLIFAAVSGLSATTAGLLQAFRPLLALLLGLALLRDRPSRLQVIGVAVILLGAYLFFPATLVPGELVAMAILLGGYALMVVCQVIGRGLGMAGLGTLTIVGVPFAIGGVVLTGVLLSVEGVPQLSGRAVAVMAWLVIGSSAAGFALMYHALRRLTNVELSSMTNLVPLVTAAFAVAVLGETLGANTASASERVLPVGLTPATIQRTHRPWSAPPPMVLVGASMTTLIVLVALFAPLIARMPYDDQDLSRSLLPPFWIPGANLTYPLGTDFLGRDLLSRLVFGARTSLVVGISAVLVSGAIGLTLGLSAGYFGRWADAIIMRLVDLQLAFPPIVLAIGILTMVEPGLVAIAAVLGAVGWVQYARVMRAQTLSLREREFVVAARVVGAGDVRILLTHILPNALGPILVIATVNVSAMILAEASLSFLGIGVRPPTPAWGTMLSESRDVFHLAWWSAAFPGLAIVWTVFGINLLGDAWQNRR